MTSPSSTLVDIRGLEKKFDLSGGLLEQISFKGGRFHRKQEAVHAINGVDLQVQKGEALCVVGESGCGKSTVARTVMGCCLPALVRSTTTASVSTILTVKRCCRTAARCR